ncbi:MAG: hypothetical protein HYZ14_09580 [Bacteroidetes bacterium]|nr:hypothetical protein [Bacteroidota bacterium]
MRFISVSCLVFLFCSCNLNYPADSNSALSGKITKAQVLQYLPGIHAGHSQKVKTIVSGQKSFRIKTRLITHSRFLFLDFAEDKKGQLANYKDITPAFEIASAVTRVYEIDHSTLALQYEDFVGRTVVVNSGDRTQITCKISKLVLVADQAYTDPYLAAVLEIPENTYLNYAWATTNKKLNPYPFSPIEDPLLSETALTRFDSLYEYQLVREKCAQKTDDFDYDETTVNIYEFRKNEKYILVKYDCVGMCGSLDESYAALYHVTPGNWVREAEGPIPFYFHDLIDVDGDMYPELLMSGFATTAIYEINFKGFSEMESVNWSTTECPC